MAEYTVGEEGATVFTSDGKLLAVLRPGTTIVPGTLDATLAPRTPGQEHPTRRGYQTAVKRPEEPA